MVEKLMSLRRHLGRFVGSKSCSKYNHRLYMRARRKCIVAANLSQPKNVRLRRKARNQCLHNLLSVPKFKKCHKLRNRRRAKRLRRKKCTKAMYANYRKRRVKCHILSKRVANNRKQMLKNCIKSVNDLEKYKFCKYRGAYGAQNRRRIKRKKNRYKRLCPPSQMRKFKN
jgi:hypothetical protein